jgi:hypothetical protein
MSQHEQESITTTPISGEPEAITGKARNGKSEVGYRRPPVHTRFKAGRSGNPHGRSAGRANAKTTMARVINETVPVREGDKTRQMTKLEAMLQTHTMKAMKGDARSASIVIGLVTRMGFLGESESKTFAVLSEEDDAILTDYVRRHTGPTERDSANDSEDR